MQFKNINQKIPRSFQNELKILALFIFLGIIGRTVLVGMKIQPFPNFEIIMVLTFLAVLFIRPSMAFLVPLFALIGSDIILGNTIFVGNHMNKIILFTYTGFLLISLLSTLTRKHNELLLRKISGKHMVSIVGMGMVFVILYDIWTNAGWWYLMYPHSLETFVTVFLAGVPFMIYHLLSAAFTFTFIAIPIGYLFYDKTLIPLKVNHYRWEKIPVMAITLLFIFLSFSGAAMQLPQRSDIWL